MPARTSLDHRLPTFRYLWARHLPWGTVGVVLLGFIGSHHLDALPSSWRVWPMDAIGSHRRLHFVHSRAGCLAAWGAPWSRLVVDQHAAVRVAGRAVRLGEHPAVVQDARRLPGVVTRPQESAPQSTPPPFGGIPGASGASSSGRSHTPFVSPLQPACLRAVPTCARTRQPQRTAQPSR
jgi:hypothetical protein